jgi:hypothetical protein
MKRSKYVCFDIETTGLTADDRVVSYCLLEEDSSTIMCCDCTEEDMLDQLADDVGRILGGKVLVTFNGENWSGGFDIPFLRTRYVINDMVDSYPFGGVKHIDLLPIFQKKFNTSMAKVPTFDDLSAAQCKELVRMCSIRPFNTKAENVKMLGALDYNHVDIAKDYLVSNIDAKVVTKHGLKHCYHLFFGGDVGMTGGDVFDLWKKGEYGKISEYNEYDCKMTMKLLAVCLATVPEYDMRYFVL